MLTQDAAGWAELLKLNVRPEQLSQCHLFLTFRARGVREKEKGGVTAGLEKPFAFAYLPLVRDNAAFVPDGNHSLALYRFESNVAVPSMYMQVPATRQGDQLPAVPQSLVKAIIPLKDSMILRTLLVSTEKTSNDTLLALLNWSKSDDVDLKRVLAELQFCSENEICKFLRCVYQAQNAWSKLILTFSLQGCLRRALRHLALQTERVWRP